MIKSREKHMNIMWSWDKTEFFKMVYSTNSNPELALLFNTTIDAIEGKAFRLKLLKTKEFKSKTLSKSHVKTGRKPKMIMGNGTVMIYMPEHLKCTNQGYVNESKLVMEKLLGRYLKRSEIVLHKNDDKGDNRKINLEVKSFYKYNVKPIDVFRDRANGMLVKEIMKKYGISADTYYSKIRKIENK